jgi:hypothetical protein
LTIAGEKKDRKSNSLHLDEFTTKKVTRKRQQDMQQQDQKLLLKACGSMNGQSLFMKLYKIAVIIE